MTNNIVCEIAAGIYRIDVNHPQPQTTCCYLIAHGNAQAIIDCGGGTRGTTAVLSALKSLAIAPEKINFLLATHAHLDHSGAAGQLMQQLPQATFAAHPDTVKHLTAPDAALVPASRALYGNAFFDTYYGGIVPIANERARVLQDDEEVLLDGSTLRVVYTPGHAWHHVSFYDSKNAFLVAGDAYGISYRQLDGNDTCLLVPVMPPSQYNPPALIASIHRLHQLGAKTIGLAHYSTLDNARYHEDYLQMLLQAQKEWQQQAELLFAEKQENFYARMKQYLLDWVRARAQERGLCAETAQKLHEHDSGLSAGGFEYYLKKNAAA